MEQLAIACLEEFHQAVQSTTLDTAIHLYQESLLLQPEIDSKFSATCGLAAALTMRFLLSGRLEDLHQANLLYSDAMQFHSFGDHDRLHCSIALCTGLLMYFFPTGELESMHAAVVDMLATDPGFDAGSRGAVLLNTYIEQSGNVVLTLPCLFCIPRYLSGHETTREGVLYFLTLVPHCMHDSERQETLMIWMKL
jgi:hypothetical protein